MVVDRWFFGIENVNMFNKAAFQVTQLNKDTHVIGFKTYGTETTNGALFRLIGCPTDTENNPANECVMIGQDLVGDGVKHTELNVKLDESTQLFMRVDPKGTAGLISGEYTLAILPKSGKVRSRAEIIQAAKGNGQIITYHGFRKYASGVSFNLEADVSDKLLIQPASQVPPAVADQLQVVSTDANDTLAGTGAQKIKFEYYDASLVKKTSNDVSMNGLTPVDIVGTYPDVFVITKSWVSQVGSLGVNAGDILFQDV